MDVLTSSYTCAMAAFAAVWNEAPLTLPIPHLWRKFALVPLESDFPRATSGNSWIERTMSFRFDGITILKVTVRNCKWKTPFQGWFVQKIEYRPIVPSDPELRDEGFAGQWGDRGIGDAGAFVVLDGEALEPLNRTS
jgi:hypothetical protein